MIKITNGDSSFFYLMRIKRILLYFVSDNPHNYYLYELLISIKHIYLLINKEL